MATYLFTDISAFKAHVGGGANVSLELSSLAPTMYMAAQNHLIPWIGETLWANLVDAVANDDATAAESALLPKVQLPLAMLTMYEYSQIGGIQFGEAGMFRMETEEMKSAYKYQENAYRDYMRHNGFEALELMLRFLDENSADYPEWTAADGFQRTRGLLLNYAADFRQVYSKRLSRYTFEVIRPVIEDVEQLAIRRFLGDDQFDRLRAGVLADDLTANETTLLKLLHRAIANYAIEEGIERNWITFSGDRVVQVESLEPQSYRKDAPPTLAGLSVTSRHQQEFGARNLSYVKKYLDENLDDFPLYKAYQEALAEAEAEEAAAASGLPADWPTCGYCGGKDRYCGCGTSPDKPKGVIRF